MACMEHLEDEEKQGDEEAEELSEEGSYEEDENWLGSTMAADVERALADTKVSTELGLLRSEVQRLRAKISLLEKQKDDMSDDFRATTQILFNRIKELEAQGSDTNSRPQTAAVIARIEKPMSDTYMCGNCRREIPAGNMVSHNTHCYRNNYRCEVCDEVLSVRDKEAHLQEWTDPAKLIDAAGRGDRAILQAMAGHGADFTEAIHPATQDSVLHAAARLGDLELITFFMGYGVEVDPVNAQGDTPLHLAADGFHPRVVRLLAELGADLNKPNSQGESPLMLTCRRGCAAAAKQLVEMRADTEARTKLGDTPLQVAQRHGHHETVIALGTAGAPLRSNTPRRMRSPSPCGAAAKAPPSVNGSAYAAPSSSGGYPPVPLPPTRRKESPSPGAAVTRTPSGQGLLR
mmetsp:Transcript_65400/g.156391  ORF Transcript_65400/g.156391 Transcript_65400/m.156391 type:complete len:404 (-) Transcript_65400:109-1320(-)